MQQNAVCGVLVTTILTSLRRPPHPFSMHVQAYDRSSSSALPLSMFDCATMTPGDATCHRPLFTLFTLTLAPSRSLSPIPSPITFLLSSSHPSLSSSPPLTHHFPPLLLSSPPLTRHSHSPLTSRAALSRPDRRVQGIAKGVLRTDPVCTGVVLPGVRVQSQGRHSGGEQGRSVASGIMSLRCLVTPSSCAGVSAVSGKGLENSVYCLCRY